ncbi:unnamed protein product [Camellia sinensis]
MGVMIPRNLNPNSKSLHSNKNRTVVASWVCVLAGKGREEFDLWIAVAAAGAGYVSKRWKKNRLRDGERSLEFSSGDSKFEREMGLKGKVVRQMEIKSDGDVFHEVFSARPHHIYNMSPNHIQSVELLEGQWGTPGCVIFWKYTHEGKPKTCKQIITELDVAKRSTTYKVIEGDLLQEYKTFTFILKVEPKGQNSLVTWTLEYEKLNEQIDAPNSMMDTVMTVCKDIETYHLK